MANGQIYKWSFIERICIAILNFGGNIVLARLLTEADYGLLAMLAIFVTLASDLSSCGLSDGLIHKLKPTERDYSTVFIVNASMGLIFGSLFFLLAPVAARFFGHDELIGITRVLSICFFFQTMGYVQETRLRKLLKQKEICFVRVSATISSLTLGIVLAANGFGYWALVSTQMILSVFMFFYFLIASRWFPKLEFSKIAFKEFFSYGWHLMVAFLGTIVGRNINTSILGKFYSSASMSGVYYQGSKLAQVPFSVSETSLNSPLFVEASNEADPERKRQILTEMFRVIIFLNSLILFALIVVARPAILLLYGEKWVGAIPILQIMAVFEFIACIRQFGHTTMKVYDRTRIVRNLSFLEIAFQLTLLGLFYHHGLIWIAWTQVGGVTLAAGIYLALYARYTRQSLWQLASSIAQSIWLPLTGAAAGWIALTATELAFGTVSSWIECLIVMVAMIGVTLTIGETAKPEVYLRLRRRVIK